MLCSTSDEKDTPEIIIACIHLVLQVYQPYVSFPTMMTG